MATYLIIKNKLTYFCLLTFCINNIIYIYNLKTKKLNLFKNLKIYY